MGAKSRLPLGRDHVRAGGDGRIHRDSGLVARERLPVGLLGVCPCRKRWSFGDCQVGQANGCQWNTATFNYATQNGHFEIMKYLLAERYPFDKRTTRPRQVGVT